VSGLAEDEPRPDEAPEAEPSEADLLSALRALKVGPFLLSTATTLTSIAYARLGDGDLDEARAAIDGVRAILPVLEGRIDDQLRRDFEQALANLQVAYADAAAGASA
jgi:hypothetical protein